MSATALRDKAAQIAAAAPDLEIATSLADALVLALADLTVIAAGRTANAGSYSYDYADLGDVVKLTRPILAKHGLVALTPVHDHGTGLACTVVLVHRSGERLDLGPFPFPHGRDAQATGSMVTYHRRYALVAALGMATGEDDDGAAAVAAPPPWNANMAKARILEVLGDKDHAKEAWVLGHGDDLTEWSRETADRLAAEWRENQPKDTPAEGPEATT